MMKDLERLKTLLLAEYEIAKSRQTAVNQHREKPSGFMRGLECAIDHIDGLVHKDGT